MNETNIRNQFNRAWRLHRTIASTENVAIMEQAEFGLNNMPTKIQRAAGKCLLRREAKLTAGSARRRIFNRLVNRYRLQPHIAVDHAIAERHSQLLGSPDSNVYWAAMKVILENIRKSLSENTDGDEDICPDCGGDMRVGKHGVGGYTRTDWGWQDNVHCEPEPDYDSEYDDRIPY